MILALNVHVLGDTNVHVYCDSCTFHIFNRAANTPVKDACFVDLSPAPPVTNVLSVVEGLPVGARLQKFWQVLAAKVSSPRMALILKERYSLKFKIKPPLTKKPPIRSGYAIPSGTAT